MCLFDMEQFQFCELGDFKVSSIRQIIVDVLRMVYARILFGQLVLVYFHLFWFLQRAGLVTRWQNGPLTSSFGACMERARVFLVGREK